MAEGTTRICGEINVVNSNVSRIFGQFFCQLFIHRQNRVRLLTAVSGPSHSRHGHRDNQSLCLDQLSGIQTVYRDHLY